MSNQASYLTPAQGKVTQGRSRGLMVAVTAVLAVLVGLLGMSTFVAAENAKKAAAFDVVQWVFCDVLPSPANTIYQMSQTSDMEFLLRSKSSVTGGKDDVTSGLNWVLDLFGPGYKKVNEDITGFSLDGITGPKDTTGTGSTGAAAYNKGVKVNPYDRFGVAGLQFSAYLGEWHYVVVNACAGGDPQDPKSNLYYEQRLEPRSTWEDIPNSTDVRTIQFDRSLGAQMLVGINDVVANGIFSVTKTIVVVTTGLINFAFSDVTEVMGINNLVGGPGGVFNSLFSGIFSTLVFVAFAFTGLSIGWQGIVNRQYRNSLNILIRSLAMFVVAIVVGAAPVFWIGLPNKVAVVGQSLLLSAVNAELVHGNELCSTDIGSAKTSIIDGTKKDDQDILSQASANMRSAVGCQYWQTFLLKPWAQGQFGTDWTNLWAKGKKASWAPEGSSELANGNEEQVGTAEVPLGDGTVINNWAIYQISTQTNVHVPMGHEGEQSKYTSGVANDWWRIVDALSNYQEEKITVGVPGDDGGTDTGTVQPTVPAGKYSPPITGETRIGAHWGQTGSWARYHTGQDYPAPVGTPVFAVGAGTIEPEVASAKSWAGTHIIIRLDNGDAVLYAHLSATSVKPGDRVTPGQEIGKVGETGRTFGPHLHFEWYPKGTTPGDVYSTKDPMILLGGTAVDNGGTTQQKNMEYWVPKDTPPTPYWDTWVGNNSGNRIWTATSSVLIAGVGLSVPLVFAGLSAVYALGIALLMALAPIFFLAACWGNKGWDLFKGWAEMVINTVLKRIATGLLLAISIALTVSVIRLMDTSLGWWQGMLLMVLLSVLLFKSRHRIIDALASIRFSGTSFASTASRLGDRLNRSGTGVLRNTGRMATGMAAGAVGAKVAGGTVGGGLASGFKNEFKNMSYRTNNRFMRNVMATHETHKTSKLGEDDDGLNGQNACDACGKVIRFEEDSNGSAVFQGGRTVDGNILCWECYSDGVDPDATEVIFQRVPKKKDLSPETQTERAKIVEAYNRRHNTRESRLTKTYTQKRVNMLLDDTDPKTGQDLTSTQRTYYLKDIARGVNMDIEEHHNGGTIPATPEFLMPYIQNKSLLDHAWEEKNYDYIRALFAAGIIAWYNEEVGEKIDVDLEGMIEDITEDVKTRKVKPGDTETREL